jgi:hypothetical protein
MRSALSRKILTSLKGLDESLTWLYLHGTKSKLDLWLRVEELRLWAVVGGFDGCLHDQRQDMPVHTRRGNSWLASYKYSFSEEP